MPQITIAINIGGFSALKQVLATPEMRQMVGHAWGLMYSSWVRQRFVRYSQGGGTSFKKGWSPGSGTGQVAGEKWAPLAESTLKGRRKQGKGAAILRDTNMLFASLAHIRIIVTNAVGVGFATLAILDSANMYSSGTTVSDVAYYHQHGGGNLPRRVIMPQIQSNMPDEGQVRGLAKQMAMQLGGGMTYVKEMQVLFDETGYRLTLNMIAVAKGAFIRLYAQAAKRGVNITQTFDVRPGEYGSLGL